MKTLIRIAGVVACSFSLLVMSGGHLFALQSVAWARMLMEYSQGDSIRNAIAKTFDGEHPCSLCLKVQKSWQERQKQSKDAPLITTSVAIEAVWPSKPVSIPQAPMELAQAGVFRTDSLYYLYWSPPKPPPRI